MSQRPSNARVFAIPSVIALASLVGLVSALVGDGAMNLLSWLALGGVVACVLWFAVRALRNG